MNIFSLHAVLFVLKNEKMTVSPAITNTNTERFQHTAVSVMLKDKYYCKSNGKYHK